MRLLMYFGLILFGFFAAAWVYYVLELRRKPKLVRRDYGWPCPRCHALVRPGINTCEWCNMPLSMAEEIPFTDIEGRHYHDHTPTP